MSHCVDTIIYLGMSIVGTKYFKLSSDYAKLSFHWAANFVIDRIVRIASEESVLRLVNAKCFWVILYDLETCPFKRADVRLLDFIIHCLFKEMFKTNNMHTVVSYFELPRATKFPLDITDK